MTATALDQLIACQGDLLRALQGRDLGALEAATTSVAQALMQVSTAPAFTPEERARIDVALRQAWAAYHRVNFLTHRARYRASGGHPARDDWRRRSRSSLRKQR